MEAALVVVILIILGAGVVYLGLLWRTKISEHTKAWQSHQILEIANETLPYLRTGLNYGSASWVSRIIFERTDSVAVAITNTSTVLGFYGIADDHHKAGEPIMTRATAEAIDENQLRILASAEEIGCPVEDCPLKGAIVVPLDLYGKAIGSLKFYYSKGNKLTENRITVAEGLAKLLSTQLELSEIDRQRELTSQAEIRALQAQINPHFLFNTLNTIAMFCRTNPNEARRLLLKLADFFRKSLEWKQELITLEKELDYINAYLGLEKARFGNQLVVTEDIDYPTLRWQLPALSLQPLVENAIKHGFCKDRALEIRITARLEHDHLLVTVEDNGRGIPKKKLEQILTHDTGSGVGIGLTNVNERLRGLYGDTYQLEIESDKSKGTKVGFRVPATEVEYEAQGANR